MNLLKLRKSTIAIISLIVVIIIVLVAVYSTFGPLQMISTPKDIFTMEGDFVGQLRGEVNMLNSEYNLFLNEQPEFPHGMSITYDGSNQYHATRENVIQLHINGQLVIKVNGITKWEMNYMTVVPTGLFPDFHEETYIFIPPSEIDPQGRTIDSIDFQDGDIIHAEIYTDGHVAGSWFHDDQFGGYYQYEQINFFQKVATWEATVIYDEGDDEPPINGEPPIDEYLTDVAGTVQDSENNKLANVECSVQGYTSTLSESDGHYELQDIPYNWTITFTKEGYITESKSGSGFRTDVRVILESTDDDIDDDENDDILEEGIPADVIIPLIFAVPFTILVLGIKFTALPIRLILVLIVDGIIAVYIIFFSGVV